MSPFDLDIGHVAIAGLAETYPRFARLFLTERAAA
jgi:hypothetical protein